MIYLDYAANAPADPAVLELFCETERRYCGNPNSRHPAGLEAGKAMEKAAEGIAALMGAEPGEVIFTSGATEANNLAILGMAGARRKTGKHIITTPLEHASVSASLRCLQKQGWEIDQLSILPDGTPDREELRRLLRRDTAMVAVCTVDSELGTIEPVDEIRTILKEYPDCRLHVDATQAVGRIPVSFDGIDTMSFAPHKFGGLNGSGVLLKRKFLTLEPILHGGDSTTVWRSGTPALALAASAECALRLALDKRQERYDSVKKMHDTLRAALSRYDCVRINSPENSVPHILNLSVRDVKGTVFQRKLAERGVCVSVKSACSSDGAPSAAVLAVSGDARNALSSWRISLSHLTTPEEIDAFLNIFDSIIQPVQA
ncbi:MAG: cysteine desulfurase [Lachnospiraceae bacterium]|jgi:cysteine desulfurase|nr:cysteine desulfurase [Lachnospiraceae bacterium]